MAARERNGRGQAVATNAKSKVRSLGTLDLPRGCAPAFSLSELENPTLWEIWQQVNGKSGGTTHEQDIKFAAPTYALT